MAVIVPVEGDPAQYVVLEFLAVVEVLVNSCTGFSFIKSALYAPFKEPLFLFRQAV